MSDGFGLAPIKREGSVSVFECATEEEDKNFPPPWKHEGCYYVLYDVPKHVKTILTQPFNLRRPKY